MKHLVKYLIFTIIPLLVCSCLKNELSIEGTLSDGQGKSLIVVYRAISKKQDFIVDQTIFIENNDRLSFKVATADPTVIWLLSGTSGELLMPIFAERGDDLKISGKYSDQIRWKVTGNKVMEQYCEWREANVNNIMSSDTGNLNSAISKYVKQNPESKTAAFILFTSFYVPGHEAEFLQLVKSLKLDEDDLSEMKKACLTPDIKTPDTKKIPAKLTLVNMNDSTVNIPLKGKEVNLLYFWTEPPSAEAKELIKSVAERENAQATTILVNPDTMMWRSSQADLDILDKNEKLWAKQGFADPQLKPLNISALPYYLLLDKSGKVLYSGPDLHNATKKLP